MEQPMTREVEAQAASQGPPTPLASSYRILIVDDEAYIQHVVRLKLANAGFDVLTASDGEEGLAIALEQHPDLIITDFQMPYLTGLAMCRRLREDPATAGIPVVMLTARGFALDDEDVAAANIRRCLSKPFSPRELVECVHEVLGEESGIGNGP